MVRAILNIKPVSNKPVGGRGEWRGGCGFDDDNVKFESDVAPAQRDDNLFKPATPDAAKKNDR